MCKFDVREEIDPKFLYYYLQSPIFLKNFYDKLSGIIGGVSIEKIRKIKMKYPDINKQKEIVKKLDEIMPLINDVEILCSILLVIFYSSGSHITFDATKTISESWISITPLIPSRSFSFILFI